MPRFLPDTSCMVASLLDWHEHYERATREIERRLSDGEILVVAAPGLVETYSVLTRFPPPRRLSPADSLALLEANFMNDAIEIVALDAQAYRRLLHRSPQQGTAGGRVYDAVIVACGLAAQVEAILTFNERQFLPLADQAIQIIVPS